MSKFDVLRKEKGCEGTTKLRKRKVLCFYGVCRQMLLFFLVCLCCFNCLIVLILGVFSHHVGLYTSSSLLGEFGLMGNVLSDAKKVESHLI